MAEVRQLLKIYRVKRRVDSEDSEKPGRFAVVTDDEVSEREEVRDSNYIGTDLYWENRFYQVRPFKQPASEPGSPGSDEKESDDDRGAGSRNQVGSAVLQEEILDKEFVMI